MVGVETDVVLLGPPIPHLHTVRTHVKFQQTPVKSRSVSDVEHSMKLGRRRNELNLCVGSLVTEAYRKSEDVSELSQS